MRVFSKEKRRYDNGLMEPVNGIGNISALLEYVVELLRLLDYPSKESAMKFVNAGYVGNCKLQEARGGSHCA
jgi:hypothetical protein